MHETHEKENQLFFVSFAAFVNFVAW